jgi:hypothetical protein
MGHEDMGDLEKIPRGKVVQIAEIEHQGPLLVQEGYKQARIGKGIIDESRMKRRAHCTGFLDKSRRICQVLSTTIENLKVFLAIEAGDDS